MTEVEIWQIVLSFFSVFATVLIALVIYWLQKRHEKEIEELNKKQYEEKVELEARIFLINNAKEIDFLPLCILSANLNINVNHKRKIYTNFNLNYADIQKEILRQAGFVEKLINEDDCWITSAMDNLYKFMHKKDYIGDNLFINIHYLNKYFKLYKHYELNEYTYQLEKEIIIFFEKNIINKVFFGIYFILIFDLLVAYK